MFVGPSDNSFEVSWVNLGRRFSAFVLIDRRGSYDKRSQAARLVDSPLTFSPPQPRRSTRQIRTTPPPLARCVTRVIAWSGGGALGVQPLGVAQGSRVSQEVACALVGPQSPRNRTDPPTPFGRDSLTYRVFAAEDRRLLVVIVPVFVVIIVVLEARVLAENLGGGGGEFVEIQEKTTPNVSKQQFRT